MGLSDSRARAMEAVRKVLAGEGSSEMTEQGIPKVLYKILDAADTDSTVFPPTILYEEGWMLRIILETQKEGVECLPFTFLPGARWYSEAQIGSPFLWRFRGDPLAEGLTHLDGAVGHFDMRSGTKTGLELRADSKQFVAIEAKIFAPLSGGVTNARYYDQAARTVACIAWAIEQSNRVAEDFESLAFYVIAPKEEIETDKFSKQTSKASIREKVGRRIGAYSDDDEKYAELRAWHDDFFIPTLELIELRCISWESAIDRIRLVDDKKGSVIRNFYNRCLRFNANVTRDSEAEN